MANLTKRSKRRLTVETLEDRTLLSSSSLGVPSGIIGPAAGFTNQATKYTPNAIDAVVQDGVTSGNVAQINWHGQIRSAAAGQWIVKLAIPGTDPKSTDAKVMLEGALKALFAAQPVNSTGHLDAGLRVTKYLGDGLFLFTADRDASAKDVVGALSKVAGFRYAEPDFIVTPSASIPSTIKNPGLFSTTHGWYTTISSVVNPAALLAFGIGGGTGVAGLAGQPLDGTGPSPKIGASFDGLSFADTNCGCFPPDTIAAVGPTNIVEAINTTVGFFDKAGNRLQVQQFADFFNNPGVSYSDPYVVYDDSINRFILEIIHFNNSGGTDIDLAISNTSDATQGWTTYNSAVSFGGNLLDFAKLGYNNEALIITGNLFGAPGTPLQGISIDKNALVNGTLTTFLWQRDGSHFRAEVPAEMHGSQPADTEYFVEEAGYENGAAARVVTATNLLSTNPNFTDTDIPVNPYGPPAIAAQPNGGVQTNDTTFTRADWRNGKLVSAQNVSEPDDNFSTSRVRWYEFDTSGGTPSLVQQGSINPGPGVSTYFGSTALDNSGDIGIDYMESSSSEFVSMYVSARTASDPMGTLRPAVDVAPGVGTRNFGRAGDYSGIGLDPADGITFWAANEYAGTDSLYNTHITAFSLGFSVTSASPAPNSFISAPQNDFTIGFSEAYDPATVAAGELTVNGIAADSVTQVDAQTLTFHFNNSPITAEGPQTLAMVGGQLHGLSDGLPLQDYNETFFFDTNPLNIVSVTPVSGSIVNLPTDLIVTFNEAVDPTTLGVSNLVVSGGSVTGFTILSPTQVDYAIGGNAVDGGTLTVKLAAGILKDTDENPGPQQGFSNTYQINVPVSNFPGLTPFGPVGSLLYQGTANATIGFVGDTDTYLINLDAGQNLTAILTPDSNLKATLEVIDPNGKSIAKVSSPAAGSNAILNALNIGPAGVFKLIVSGASSTTGAFSLHGILNAGLQTEQFIGGTTDNTLASAQSLESLFRGLTNGVSARAGVIGQIPLSATAGDVYVSARGGGVQLLSGTTGAVEATFNDPSLSTGVIQDVELGQNGDVYVGIDTNPGAGNGGEILHFSASGTLLATIKLPNDSSGNFFYPFGFDVAIDGTLWVAAPNSGSIIHADAMGNLIQQFSVGGDPEWVAVRPDGQVFFSEDFASAIDQLDPTTGNVTTFALDPFGAPLGLTINPAGGLIVADPNAGVLVYDASGNLVNTIFDFNAPIDAQVDPSGNILAATFFAGLDKFDAAGNFILNGPVSGNALGLAVIGTDSLPPPPADTTDYYSFKLKKGQTGTVEISSLDGGQVSEALVAADGSLLALAKPVSGGGTAAINGFVAPADGTYYVRVTGGGVQYSLTVNRGSDFDNYTNSTFATAQLLVPDASSGGVRAVQGAVQPGTAALYGIDWQQASRQIIDVIDPATGNFLSSFLSPSTTLTNPFGFNMAVDGATLYFNDGAFFGDNTIYKLDPTTGAVRGSIRPNTALLTGLAFLNGALYGSDLQTIYKIDPSSGAVLDTFSPGLDGAVTGLAGDPTRGVLWAVSQTHTLFEIDPVGKKILKSGSDGLSLNEQDLGFQNNELFVSETTGPGNNDIAVFDPDTFALKRDLPVAVTGPFISGLGADGVTSQNGFYQFNAKAGDKLTITTDTPFGDPQRPGEPHNYLDPKIELYNSQGQLVGSDDNSGADGKNASLKYKVVQTGTYFVRVLGANNTNGTYVLTVSGANQALPGFTVTGTNPAANAHVQTLTSITVDFSDSILLTTLPTAQVTIGGQPVTGFTVNNDHEVTFSLPALPGGDGIPYKFAIKAGTIKNIHGVGLSSFSETIFLDTVAPRVVKTSLEEGAVIVPGTLTYTATFSEKIDPASVSAASFNLHGQYRAADYAASSFSFDSTGKVLTIKYSGLPDDAYKLTLFASGFADLAGNILDGEPHTPRPPSIPSGDGVPGGDFFIDFAIDEGKTIAFPGSFAPVNPIGSQIYEGSATKVIAPVNDTDSYTLKLAKNQTLTIDLTTGSTLEASVALYDTSGNLIDSVSAVNLGEELVLQTEPIAAAGTYKIVIGGVGGTQGIYTINATLNAAIQLANHGGTSNSTQASAQIIDGSFLNLGNGASRGAAIGQLAGAAVNPGDVFVSARGGGVQLLDGTTGLVKATFNDPALSNGVVQDVELGSNGDVYVGLDRNPGGGNDGVVLHFTASGTLLATIKLPNDSSGNFFYPFGFDVATDGTFWVAAPNSGSIIHADAMGNLIQQYAVGGDPEWVAVRSDGQVFFSEDFASAIDQLDPTSGNVTTFAVDPYGAPLGVTINPAGGLIVADPNVGVLEYDASGNLVNTIFDFNAVIDAQVDPSGNIFGVTFFSSLDKFDSAGNFILSGSFSGNGIGLAVVGTDGPGQPPPQNWYSFSANAHQSLTIDLTQLGGSGAVDVALVDGQGNVLAIGVPVNTNVGEEINFVTSAAGTYFLKVTGSSSQYSLVVSKNATFDTEPNNDQSSAQPLPASGTALGAVFSPGTVTPGAGFEGLSFSDTNCGCIPPDTNLAVGPTQVVETTNTAIRVYDKATGNILLSEEIADFLGLPAGTGLSDPYIVYDDIAGRFVFEIVSFNNSGGTDLQFAASHDSNILDGVEAHSISFGGNLLDFAKLGYNADAYVITGNLFGPPNVPLQVIAIDKASALDGDPNTFTFYESQRAGFPTHFRAEVPAQMHGAKPGDPLYLVEENGYGNGSAANVVKMTNILSNNPTFVDTPIAVNAYGFPPPADQPGAPGSVATNDTTFTHAEWRNGKLVSAQSVGEPDDNFSTSRVRWYEFDTTTPTPTLLQQGTIHPGAGISTYFGTVTINNAGDLGFTYMESSSNEFVSMYITGHKTTDPLGSVRPGVAVAPGTQFGNFFFRAGDYSGVVVDPSDGTTFWAANEYQGTNFIYNTFVSSFTIPSASDEDWYSVNTNDGDNLKVTLTLPGSSNGSLFVNKLTPVIELYNANGVLVASGTTSLNYKVKSGEGGDFAVRVTSSGQTQGEYVLHVAGATGGVSPHFAVPPRGAAGLTNPAGGLNGSFPSDADQQAALTLLSPANWTSTQSFATAVQNAVSQGIVSRPAFGFDEATAATHDRVSDALFTQLGQTKAGLDREELLASLAHQLVFENGQVSIDVGRLRQQKAKAPSTK